MRWLKRLFRHDARKTRGQGGKPTRPLRAEALESRNLLATAGGDSYFVPTDGTLATVTPYAPGAPSILQNDGWTSPANYHVMGYLDSGPSHGTLTESWNDENEDTRAQAFDQGLPFIYTPDAGFTGKDTFEYHITDPDGNAYATVTIYVAGAGDDSFQTPPNGTVSSNLLANDPCGFTMGADMAYDPSAQLVNSPAHGTATVTSSGNFTYTPAANFHGIDTFTYEVTYGFNRGESAGTYIFGSVPASVTIAVDNAPDATDDSYIADAGNGLTVGTNDGLLANDGDDDGDLLAASLVSGPCHGTVTINSDGSFIYTADSAYVGGDSFVYRASDGYLYTDATAQIEVGHAPVAADDNYSLSPNVTDSVPASSGVLQNDTDADGDTLAASLVSDPAHGSLTLNSDGSFSYTPDSGFHGVDSFTYAASDGVASSNATVAIAVDDTAPVANGTFLSDVPGYTAAYVDVPISVDVLDPNNPLATDPDGDPIVAVELVDGPQVGSVRLNGSTFTYTPSTTGGGVYFTYRVFDGFLWSAPAGIGIGYFIVPHPYDDEYSVAADQTLTVGGYGVLENDYNGLFLSASIFAPPDHGHFATNLNSDGTFVYIPDAGFTGDDTFSYIVTDGNVLEWYATVTIHVG